MFDAQPVAAPASLNPFAPGDTVSLSAPFVRLIRNESPTVEKVTGDYARVAGLDFHYRHLTLVSRAEDPLDTRFDDVPRVA